MYIDFKMYINLIQHFYVHWQQKCKPANCTSGHTYGKQIISIW